MKLGKHQLVLHMNRFVELLSACGGMKIRNLFLISDRRVCIAIFLLATLTYLLLGGRFHTGDTVPTSLAALNLLNNGTLYFNNFRDSYLSGDQAYYFAETIHGDLSSVYPVGASIVSFPIYLILHSYLVLFHPGIDITTPEFEPYRLLFQSIASALIAAISVVVLYIALRLNFSVKTSILVAIIFAFGTSTWSTSARALWQHGSANLILVCGIYFLMLTSRATAKSKLLRLLLFAGLCFGFLPAVRPTSAIFSIACLAYGIYTYRVWVLSFVLGFASYLPVLLWNTYNFGKISGGYSSMFGQPPYLIEISHFVTTALGHLISPSRGLLVASPILIFSAIGLFNLIRSTGALGRDKWLLYTLCIASCLLFIQYSFYTIWWGGYSFGPRFMTDILVPLCYLLGYSIEDSVGISSRPPFLPGKSLIFYPLFGFSILVQIAFVLGGTGALWNPYPVDINLYPNRTWHLRDSQINRHVNSLILPLRNQALISVDRLHQMSGIIRDVQVAHYDPILNPFNSLDGGSADGVDNNIKGRTRRFSKNEVLYARVALTNTGTERWFGVYSALVGGETRVRGHLYDAEGQLVSSHDIFLLADTVDPAQDVVAIANLTLPAETGTYQLIFDLVLQDVGAFTVDGNSEKKLDFIVE